MTRKRIADFWRKCLAKCARILYNKIMRGSAVRPKERAARAADAKREDELCRQGAAEIPQSDYCQKESMRIT